MVLVGPGIGAMTAATAAVLHNVVAIMLVDKQTLQTVLATRSIK